MDNTFQSPAVLSLCTGMRGLERGLERVLGRINTVAYVEIESFIIENLVQQMEQGILDPAPVWSNVKTFPWNSFHNKVHWIIGGYPCQPFSHAGLRKGKEDERHLWPSIKSGIKKSRPVGCFFENVEGHLSLGLGSVLKDLRQLGYQTEVGLFSAAEVGAPHRRNRVFILALENAYLFGDGRSAIKNFLSSRTVALSAKGPGELDNSDGIGSGSEHQIPARRDRAEYAGEGLANADPTRQQQLERLQREGGERTFDGGEVSGISDATSEGLSQWKEQHAWQEHQTVKRSSDRDESVAYTNLWWKQQWDHAGVGRSQQSSSWPARPGENQHAWEPSRTIESRMGYVAHGYSYREDLLRMAGNAVVEQQAELAFRTLIQKFL